MKKYAPLLANVLSQTIFGVAYILVKIGMSYVDQNAVKFLSFRFTTGFVVMTLLLLLGFKKVNYKNRPYYMILICGLFNPMTSQILETTSTTYAPASQISLYNSILPVIMLLFSALINHEYPTKRQLMFVLVTVAGLFVANLTDKSEAGLTTIGLILIVATNIVVAVNRVLVRRTSGEFDSFEIVYLTTGMGAAFFTMLSLSGHVVTKGALNTYFAGLMQPWFFAAVLYMGIGSCVIAFLLMTYASAHLPFAVYSSTCSISTVVGIVSGVVLLHEVFTPMEVAGAIIILIGVIGISLSYDKNDKNGNRFQLKKKS